MYIQRRVYLFHKDHKDDSPKIFEFRTEKEELEVKAHGWVENPADLEVEPIQESIPESGENIILIKNKVGRPIGSKNRRPPGNLGGRLL